MPNDSIETLAARWDAAQLTWIRAAVSESIANALPPWLEKVRALRDEMTHTDQKVVSTGLAEMIHVADKCSKCRLTALLESPLEPSRAAQAETEREK